MTEPATSPDDAGLSASIFARDNPDPSILLADGYGLSLTVDHGHLLIRDGLGRHRRQRRLPRAQRQVRRIILLGHTGHITLDAIRWCTDTGIAILQIDSDGRILLTAAAPGKDDPRLRRAQAAAATGPVGLHITRHFSRPSSPARLRSPTNSLPPRPSPTRSAASPTTSPTQPLCPAVET